MALPTFHDVSKMDDLDGLTQCCIDVGDATPLMATILNRDPWSLKHNRASNTPERVRKVLDNHRDYAYLNQPDRYTSTTPLMQLACIPHMPNVTEMAQVLLEPKYGVDIHARSGPIECQAIFAAAEMGSTGIVKLLVDRGADLFSSVPNQQPPTTPINIAIQNNHVEIVALLVQAAKKAGQLDRMLNDTRNGMDQTSVQVAMTRRRTEIIGIMARAAGDLRNSFYAVWDEDPLNTQKCVWADPDPEEFPETWSLYKTVYSFVSKTCCECREPVVQTCCSQCTMAWYCGADCQKKDWKMHKKCCKKLKRGVDLVLGSGKRKLVPYPLVEQTGFEEDYVDSKNQLEKDFDYNYSWEYHGVDDKDPTKRIWKKYPPLINFSIESLFCQSGPRYMYRPNEHDLEGFFHNAPFGRHAPLGMSTRYVYFGCMMEFDVYTGAARAVRRIAEDPPQSTTLPSTALLSSDGALMSKLTVGEKDD